MPISYYTRKKAIFAKKEATYGLNPAIDEALNAIRTLDFAIQPFNNEAIETNEDLPMPGSSVSELVGLNVVVTFGVFFAGAGTAGNLPAYDPLLAGCGYVGDNTTDPTRAVYTQVFPVTDSLTFMCDLDGKMHEFNGSRGTFEIVSVKRGFARMNYTYTGIFTPVVASSLTPGNADLSGFLKALPFRAANVDVQFFGQTVAAHSYTFRSGEDIAFRETSTEETIEAGDRRSSYELRFDEPLISTYDYWNDAGAGTTGPLNYALGTTAGNIVEVNLLKTQILNIDPNDEQGGSALQVSGPVVADTSNSFSPVQIIVR